MGNHERQPVEDRERRGGDPVGSLLARKYRVVRRIGGGSVADVYEAVHEQIGGRLALKILRREYARLPDISRRFLNEARAAGAAGHPGIVQVFDLGQLESGELFMVMELLQGEELATLLAREGPLPVPRSVGIAVQLLEALEAAHRAGVVHRDLKPENVFVVRGPNGEDWVKIIDFGIARLTQDGPGALRRTAEGSVMGSPYYMSPEQARGHTDLDARTDIYAAGVIFYEMLAACLPYTGISIAGIVERVLNDPFPSVRDRAAAVPEELERAILKATARRREERFATSAEFADALRPFRGEPGAPPPPPRRDIPPPPSVGDVLGAAMDGSPVEGRPRRSRIVVPARVYLAAVAAAAVAALLGVGLLSLLYGASTTGPAPVGPLPGDSRPTPADAAVAAESMADAGTTAVEAADVAFAAHDAGIVAVPPSATDAGSAETSGVGDDAEPRDGAEDAAPLGPEPEWDAAAREAAREAVRDGAGEPPHRDAAVASESPRDRGLADAFEPVDAAPLPDAEAAVPADGASAGGPDADPSPPPVTDAGETPGADAPGSEDIGFAPNPFRG